MTGITYGDWNLPYGKLAATMSEDEARALDAKGEEYWVLFGDPQSPEQVMRISEDRLTIRVIFLDELRRPYLDYLFVHLDPNRVPSATNPLYLEQVHTKEFEGDNSPPIHKVVAGEGTFFHTDGKVYSSRELRDGTVESGETSMPMDVFNATMLEPNPTFGDWASIARKDRDQPPPERTP